MPHISQYGHGKYPKLNRKTPEKLLPPPCVLLQIACLITQRPRIGFMPLPTNSLDNLPVPTVPCHHETAFAFCSHASPLSSGLRTDAVQCSCR
jgi:hypothetical protein